MERSPGILDELQQAIGKDVRFVIGQSHLNIAGTLVAIRGSLAILETRYEMPLDPDEVITPEIKVLVKIARRIVNLSDVIAVEVIFDAGEVDANKG